MTCVIGYVHEGKVYMGGDSAITYNGDMEFTTKCRKVFRNGDILFGCSGDLRIIQLLQYGLLVDAIGEDETVEHYMQAVAEKIRCLMRDRGYSWVNSNKEYFSDAGILAAFQGRLFHIDTNFSVMETHSPFLAVGNGKYVAVGALEALWLVQDETDPLFTVQQALRIAGRYMQGVCEPYYVEVLE